jgi:hypothetical protein
MSQRSRIAVALALVTIFCLFALEHYRSFSPGPGEPRVHGRTLTDWIEQAETHYPPYGPPPEKDPRNLAALEVVKAIGTNAIPTLLQMLQAKDNPARVRFNSWSTRLHIPFRFRDGVGLHSLAHDGFAILKRSAISATPDLIRLAREDDAALSRRGLFCLVLINPHKETLLPILTNFLHAPAFKKLQPSAASLLRSNYPEEAETAGVYDLFPTLRALPTNAPAQVNPQAAAPSDGK